MLTRCTTGMVLVTNRNFLCTAGRETLLGKLAQRWGTRRDLWVDPPGLSDRSASLPGVPGMAAPVVSFSSVPPEPSAKGSPARVVPGAWPGANSNHTRSRLGSRTSCHESVPAANQARGRALSEAVRSVQTSHFAQGSGGQLASPSRQASDDVPERAPGVQFSTAVSHSHSWRHSGMRGSEEHFPTLDGGVAPAGKRPQAKGRWAAGSEACKL